MTSRTIADPAQRVSAGWVVRFSLAWVGLYAGLFGPLEVLLPRQVEQLAPEHKEAALALVLGAGAACSLKNSPGWAAG